MYTRPNLGLGNMAQLLVEVPPAEPKWYFCIFRQNKLELLKKNLSLLNHLTQKSDYI